MINTEAGGNCVSLKDYIKADLSRIRDNWSLSSFLSAFFSTNSASFRFTVLLRTLYFCKQKKFLKYSIGLPIYFMVNHMGRKYGVHINANTPIGPGFRIVHMCNIYLNCSQIGKNFTVYQGVTLGSASLKRNKDIPGVRDNVTVYTGSVCVGDITLGNNSVVSANSFVNTDVCMGGVVQGVPAKLIKVRDNCNE